MKNCQTNSEAGFTKKELVATIAGFVLLSILAFVFFTHLRVAHHREACINHLRLIDGMKQQWALEHPNRRLEIPTASDVMPYGGRGGGGRNDYFEETIPCPAWYGLPYCPDDPLKKFTNSYAINNVTNPPACKIVPASHILP